jgi:hypothetical protein
MAEYILSMPKVLGSIFNERDNHILKLIGGCKISSKRERPLNKQPNFKPQETRKGEQSKAKVDR